MEKARKLFEAKEEYFIRNIAMLLKKQITCNREYLDTLRVTKKCDVYGFGVELVEVLTGHHPIEMFLEYINLVDCFVLSMEENCILQIVDDVVLSQGSNEDIQAFTKLALRCIKKKGDERPAMREVTLELRWIQHLIWSKQNNETSSA
uniref:Serine-threonine/tyrosine-protein kinase catalytic domain-containing protein n=1 Tax=Quercus lobata TaxID=97700 RepID=A0A7N2M9T9_QUELO